MTRTAFRRLIKIIGTSVIVLLIAAFAVWRSLSYVRGPEIIVSQPTNGATITQPSVIIKGRVLRAKNLSLNGKEINIDEQGDFSEEIIVFPGMNIITLSAKDQFGRSTEDRLTLVGNDFASSTTL